MTLDSAVWLLGGFLVAGLIHVWVPVKQVASHLGKPNLSGVLKAAILGMPLPLCSCSVIPVAASIRKQGASRGATAAFLISTPETGVDSIALTYALLGPWMAVLRPVAALLSAILAGIMINRFTDRPTRESVTTEKSCAGGSCCCESAAPASLEAGDPPRGLMSRAYAALHYGFVEMFADLAGWLVLGFLLAGAISAMLPVDLFDRYVGSGPLTLLLVLVIALPFYVCATASTPVAAAMMAKGLSPGAALVFLLAGPASNMATILVVGRDLGRRSLIIYLSSIGLVSIGLGLVVDYCLVRMTLPAVLSGHAHGERGWIAVIAAVAFVALIVNGLRLRLTRRRVG